MRFSSLILLTASLCITELTGLPLLSKSSEPGDSVIPATERRVVGSLRTAGESIRAQASSDLVGQFEGTVRDTPNRKRDIPKGGPNTPISPPTSVGRAKTLRGVDNKPLTAKSPSILYRRSKDMTPEELFRLPRSEQGEFIVKYVREARAKEIPKIKANSQRLRDHYNPDIPFQLGRRELDVARKNFMAFSGRIELLETVVRGYPELAGQLNPLISEFTSANSFGRI